ncbi:MAG: glycosyltransferase family 4 protein [Lachnospiraceae bacterium]|nr:glycosyltransferase family 4 protein [Lachnospiraceae bacterium]MDE6185526.1 glycosyltransferase family 4 protein [Lachnospiraceae bacterium]
MDREKLRIAFFIGNMGSSGGTERVLSVIANGLSERGHHVSIMSLRGTGRVFFPVSDAVKIYWLEKEVPKAGIIKKIQSLAVFLNFEHIDFLIDVDIILCFYSLFLKRLRPQMHWISWEHFNFYYHFRKNHFLRSMARRLVARYSECLVVLSEEDKGYYKEKLNLKCKITRIYNPNPYEDKAPKEMGEPMIFAAGRLTKAKGFDLLIKSWKLLEDRYPKWKVMVAGEGTDRKKLEKEIESAGIKRFDLVGNTDQIEQYYRRAEIFALPSRDEGFGMVLLEAMAFSLPAVGYACKAGPKEIIEEGENGFLVIPGDVEMFARKMEILMQDAHRRRKMGEKARESTKRFQREQILDAWELLLHEMVEQTG